MLERKYGVREKHALELFKSRMLDLLPIVEHKVVLPAREYGLKYVAPFSGHAYSVDNAGGARNPSFDFTSINGIRSRALCWRNCLITTGKTADGGGLAAKDLAARCLISVAFFGYPSPTLPDHQSIFLLRVVVEAALRPPLAGHALVSIENIPSLLHQPLCNPLE